METEILPPKTEVKTEEVLTTTPIRNISFDSLQNDQKRRSSSRSIKRKRFDDEIVEYSIGQTQARELSRLGRQRTISQNIGSQVSPLLPPVPPLLVPQTSAPSVVAPIDIVPPTITTTEASPQVQQQPITPNVINTIKLPTPTPVTTPATPQLPVQTQFAAIERNIVSQNLTATERRRPMRSNNRRARRSGRPANQPNIKDLGRWKPIDDLALVIGVQQTNDLRIVHRGTKFSCKFTMQELQTRWQALLYDPAISRIAVAAMRNLHPELIESVQRNALYSVQEEELLGTIKSSDNPKLEQFQELLSKNTSAFFASRTAKTLHAHWQMLKRYQLLPDQIVKPLHLSDQPLGFSDAEDLIIDAELADQRDEALEIELTLADRQQKREIRLLENELTRWNVLVDSISGVGLQPEFDSQTLAILRGRLVRYLMRSKEITLGREAQVNTVDVDFSLEGPSSKISRRQGTIKLRSNGDFFIANEGKRPLYIDGIPLLTGNKARLVNNCVLEVCGLRFVFLINYELINAIRIESAKTTAALN